MNKPISLIIEESTENIAKAINESNLHPILLEPILRRFYEEAVQNRNIIAQKEKEKYLKSLKDDSKDE